jgi:hypothetical protein
MGYTSGSFWLTDNIKNGMRNLHISFASIFFDKTFRNLLIKINLSRKQQKWVATESFFLKFLYVLTCTKDALFASEW